VEDGGLVEELVNGAATGHAECSFACAAGLHGLSVARGRSLMRVA
jgi:hypothetical protein